MYGLSHCRRSLKIAKEKLGYDIVGIESFPTGFSDFSAALAKAKIAQAGVIMPIFDMAQSGILPKQWRSMRIPALIAGFMSPMNGPGAWNTFEGKIGGTINVNFEIGSAICPQKYEPTMKFCAAYLKKYGQPLEGGHGAAPSYDAVYILAEAIERAGTLDPDRLAEEIKKTDRQGVIGRIKFDEGQQVIYGEDPAKTACAAVAQWTEDGKRHIVFPEPLAHAKFGLQSGSRSSRGSPATRPRDPLIAGRPWPVPHTPFRKRNKGMRASTNSSILSIKSYSFS